MLSASALAAILALLLVAAPLPAMAQRGLLCETVWTKADANNDIGQCFSKIHLLAYLMTPERLVVLILGGIFILVGLFEFLSCPFATCFRYCCQCCGGSGRRPDSCCCGDEKWDVLTEEEVSREYSRCSVYCTKITALLVVVVSVVSIILCVVGTQQLLSSWNLFFANIADLVKFIKDKGAEIRTGLTITNDDGTSGLVFGLDPNMFNAIDSAADSIKGMFGDLQTQGDLYIKQATDYSLIVALVPVIVLVMTIVCALCNIRSFIPMINSIFCWILILIFGLVGGLFLVLTVFVVDIEAERQKVFNNSPGIVTWWLIPKMEAMNLFGTVETTVRSLEASMSRSACNQLAQICTNTRSTWLLTDPVVLFSCNITKATNCSTVAEVNYNLASLSVLDGSLVGCSNVTKQQGQCTVAVCAKTCNQTETKSLSSTLISALRNATVATTVFYNIVIPFLNVRTLFVSVFSRLTVLAVLAASTQAVAAGFALYTIAFMVNLVIMFRGQKRFFSYPDDLPPEQSQMDGAVKPYEMVTAPPPEQGKDVPLPGDSSMES